MSALKDTLSQATKEAMKARDKDRVATLRMVNAELKRIEVDERRELSDEDVFTVLNKMLKQRKDAWQQFTDAGREDLAAIEAYEITVIEGFLPAQMEGGRVRGIRHRVTGEIRCPRYARHGQGHGFAEKRRPRPGRYGQGQCLGQGAVGSALIHTLLAPR
jgi:uncharacterized protein YqeY